MTHFIKVSIVIVLVTIVFFNSSIIENIVDPSYNEYDYLRKIRRTHNVVESDNEDKGWQDDGTFKSWYQKGNGSENDKYLNNITPNQPTSIDAKVDTSKSPHVTSSNSGSNKLSEPVSNTTNILPYMLLLLLFLVVGIILYVKYK